RSRFVLQSDFSNCPNMFRRSSAATADDIYQLFVQIFLYLGSHLRGTFIIFSERVWQSCIWIGAHGKIGAVCNHFKMGRELFGAQSTIETYAQKWNVRD